jgi:TfoX/Sxy family transcriptional regulator of competence genes
MKISFNLEHKQILDSLLLSIPQVTSGKMFGYPAYYVQGKLCACVINDAVGVKVPADLAQKLLTQNHITPFQPFGRPKMKEWIQINHTNSSDYLNDKPIFTASIQFIASLNRGS